MKHFILYISLFIIQIGNSQEIPTLKELFLKGKVKTVNIQIYAVFESTEKQTKWITTPIFEQEKAMDISVNNKGFITEYTTNDFIKYTTKITYDDKDRPINIKEYKRGDFLRYEYTFVYDDKNKTRQEYIYNGEIKEKRLLSTCTLNKDNQPTYCTYYDDECNERSTSTYQYDIKGNKIFNRVAYYFQEYEYTSEGFLKRHILTINKKGIEGFELNYTYGNGDFPETFTVKQEEYQPPKTYTFKYKLDEQGNWVQKTVYYDGKEVNIIERKITYW